MCYLFHEISPKIMSIFVHAPLVVGWSIVVKRSSSLVRVLLYLVQLRQQNT